VTRTRIKICGLTSPDAARAAVEAGADAIGLVFAASPRQLSIEQAATVAAAVPPPVGRIGVFVDADPDFVALAVQRCALTAVQLCGSETPETCSAMPVPVIKVLGVGTDFGWEVAEPYRGHAAALLLDTYNPTKAGGTSQTFDWQALGDPPDWAPVFVAGGLNAENVGRAIAALHPFAVDVSSGVESSPGIKNPERMAAFCAAVRAADEEVA
jgi:phosphoribosylanthranilate isomerase